jgi:hypothetical protein
VVEEDSQAKIGAYEGLHDVAHEGDIERNKGLT